VVLTTVTGLLTVDVEVEVLVTNAGGFWVQGRTFSDVGGREVVVVVLTTGGFFVVRVTNDEDGLLGLTLEPNADKADREDPDVEYGLVPPWVRLCGLK